MIRQGYWAIRLGYWAITAGYLKILHYLVSCDLRKSDDVFLLCLLKQKNNNLTNLTNDSVRFCIDILFIIPCDWLIEPVLHIIMPQTSYKHKMSLILGWDEEKHMAFAKKTAQNDTIINNISYICTDSNSPKGWAGHNMLVKRTFTNVIFGCWISQIQDQKIRNRTSTLGVLHSVRFYTAVSIYLGVGYRVAYPGQGNARAQQRDRRSRAPTSFRF